MANYTSTKAGFIQEKEPKFPWIRKVVKKIPNPRKAIFSNQRLGNAIYWCIKILIVVVTSKLGYDVYKKAEANKHYYFSDFELPPNLTTNGITGNLVSNLIIDDIKYIDSNVSYKRLRFGKFPMPVMKLDLETINSGDELTYSGVSYTKLVSFLANIFSTKRYIKGNILSDSLNEVRFRISFSDNPVIISYVTSEDILISDKIRLASNKIALDLYKYLNPLRHAFYTYNCKDWAGCLNLLSEISTTNDNTDLMYINWLKGSCLKQMGRYDESIFYFNQSLKYDVTEFYNYSNIIENYLSLNELDSVKIYIKKIEDNKYYHKRVQDLYFLKALYSSANNRHLDAIKLYKQCLSIDSMDIGNYENMAISFAELNMFDSASKYLDYYKSKKPFVQPIISNALGYHRDQVEFDSLVENKRYIMGEYKYGKFVLASYFYGKRYYDSADYYLNKAIEIDENFDEAYSFKGLLMYLKQDYTTANELFAIAYDLNPSSQFTLSAWIDNLVAQRDPVNARAKCDILDRLYYSSNSISKRGDTYGVNNNYPKMKFYYQTADQFCSSDFQNLSKLAAVYYLNKEYDKTIGYCNRILEVDSNYTNGLFILGKCKVEIDRIEQVRNIAKKINRLGDTYRSALLNAEIEKQYQNYDRAKDYYLEAYKYNNYDTSILNYLIDYYNYNDRKKALPFLLNMESIESLSDNGNFRVGDCYIILKDYRKALIYFKRSLIQNPLNCNSANNWLYCLQKLGRDPLKDSQFMNRIRFLNCEDYPMIDYYKKQRTFIYQ